MNILLTCAGRRNYLVKYFREALNGEGLIITTDCNPYAPAMLESDMAITMPTIESREYIPTLLKVCQKNDVGLLIPLNDLELPIISSNKADFLAIGTLPIISDPNVIDICFDKLKTFEFLTCLNIPTPVTFINVEHAIVSINAKEINFPLVIKPRWGTASIAIEVANNIQELKLMYDYVQNKLRNSIISPEKIGSGPAVLVQEFIAGTEFGLDIVNGLNGEFLCAWARRKLGMRAGETDKAVTILEPGIHELGSKIGKRLKHKGNLDCDVFYHKDQWFLLEMNPRFGGGYPFSHVAGANLPKILIELAKNGVPDPSCFVIRENVLSSKYDNLISSNLQPLKR